MTPFLDPFLGKFSTFFQSLGNLLIFWFNPIKKGGVKIDKKSKKVDFRVPPPYFFDFWGFWTPPRVDWTPPLLLIGNTPPKSLKTPPLFDPFFDDFWVYRFLSIFWHFFAIFDHFLEKTFFLEFLTKNHIFFTKITFLQNTFLKNTLFENTLFWETHDFVDLA